MEEVKHAQSKKNKSLNELNILLAKVGKRHKLMTIHTITEICPICWLTICMKNLILQKIEMKLHVYH